MRTIRRSLGSSTVSDAEQGSTQIQSELRKMRHDVEEMRKVVESLRKEWEKEKRGMREMATSASLEPVKAEINQVRGAMGEIRKMMEGDRRAWEEEKARTKNEVVQMWKEDQKKRVDWYTGEMRKRETVWLESSRSRWEKQVKQVTQEILLPDPRGARMLNEGEMAHCAGILLPMCQLRTEGTD